MCGWKHVERPLFIYYYYSICISSPSFYLRFTIFILSFVLLWPFIIPGPIETLPMITGASHIFGAESYGFWKYKMQENNNEELNDVDRKMKLMDRR